MFYFVSGYEVNLLNLSNSHLLGQFIEKEKILAHIALPTGETFEEWRADISIVNFIMWNDRELNLELTNPPRGLKTFFEAISDLTNQRFTYAPVDLDPLIWINHLERRFGQGTVKSLECSNVQWSPDVLGRLSLKSGFDVRNEFGRIIRNKRCAIENASCEFSSMGNHFSLTIFRSGAVKSPELSGRGFLNDIRLSIKEARSAKL